MAAPYTCGPRWPTTGWASPLAHGARRRRQPDDRVRARPGGEGQPLTATAAGQTTFYLFGLGAIGEQTSEFAYYLKDADVTTRQLTDAAGDPTLVRSFTAWGNTSSSLAPRRSHLAFFGGLLDAATGLIYLQEGQYYDPETGRFLTPGRRGFAPFRPGTLNPYVPWGGADALGALLAPLALMLLFPRRKKLGRRERFLLIHLLVLAAGGALGACGGDQGTATPEPDGRDVSQPLATPPSRDGGKPPPTGSQQLP